MCNENYQGLRQKRKIQYLNIYSFLAFFYSNDSDAGPFLVAEFLYSVLLLCLLTLIEPVLHFSNVSWDLANRGHQYAGHLVSLFVVQDCMMCFWDLGGVHAGSTSNIHRDRDAL